MAKTGAYRWRGWPSNNSKHNPDGRQRDCNVCRKPFVPYADWNLRCPRCTSEAKQRGAEEESRRTAAEMKTAATVGATKKAAAAKAAPPKKKPAPPAAKARPAIQLRSQTWPPIGCSREMPLSATTTDKKLTLSWAASPGIAEVRIYDRNGLRVAYHRGPAERGTQRFGKLLATAQPLTVLFTVKGAETQSCRHARISTRVK